jgi:hypothetical protein
VVRSPEARGDQRPRPHFLFGRGRPLVIGVLIFCLVWFAAINFTDLRSEGTDPQKSLRIGPRATYSPWIAPTAQSSKPLGLALLNYGYFVSPLPSLIYYNQQTAPGPFYGEYSFPLPARLLRRVTGTQDPDRWNAIRREIFGVFAGRGYYPNVWPTWLRDLRLDFGYLGAVCFCGLFGGFMAWARNRFELTGAAHYHCLTAIAALTFAFGAFQNLLFVGYVANAFFAGLAFMVAVRVTVEEREKPSTLKGEGSGSDDHVGDGSIPLPYSVGLHRRSRS